MISSLFLASYGEWAEMFGTMALVFGCILGVVFIYSAIKDKTNSKKEDSGCMSPILVIIGILLFVAIINMNKCSCSFPTEDEGYYHSDPIYKSHGSRGE